MMIKACVISKIAILNVLVILKLLIFRIQIYRLVKITRANQKSELISVIT